MQYLSKKSQILGEHVVFVLASRRTNFYKIPIFGYIVMPQKHIFLVKRAALGSQKKKIFFFFCWV
jgi:hypothetical protein